MVERNTYTPRGIPQAAGNCDLRLKALRGRSGASGSKTSSNRPDEALTVEASAETGQDSRKPVPAVFVLSQKGFPLMPTTPRKARVLLKQGKAEVKKRTPFTIQLLYVTGEASQPITLGIDPGYKNMGVSCISGKKELYCAEIQFRTDMVELLSERRAYRRNRRNRKTRYRKPRFLNRAKPKGSLPPSVRHRVDSHIRVVNEIKRFLPITGIVVETAAFDIQKIRNPEIQGTEYQEGAQKYFHNVREYCLARDLHTCRNCGGRSKDKILNIHHLESRRTGGDRPENLVTLCRTCHAGHHVGNVTLKLKSSKGFKAETFMSLVNTRVVDVLGCGTCFGYETKYNRHKLSLVKTHGNDAFVIAGGRDQTRSVVYVLKQVRKQNRKLHKGPHSNVKNTAPRFVLGFIRYDKVRYRGQECFVFGRRTSGYFNLRTIDGGTINANANSNHMQRLESGNSWLVIQKPETQKTKGGGALSTATKGVVSAPKI